MGEKMQRREFFRQMAAGAATTLIASNLSSVATEQPTFAEQDMERAMRGIWASTAMTLPVRDETVYLGDFGSVRTATVWL